MVFSWGEAGFRIPYFEVHQFCETSLIRVIFEVYFALILYFTFARATEEGAYCVRVLFEVS